MSNVYSYELIGLNYLFCCHLFWAHPETTRNLLCETGFFGAERKLETAFKEFTAWARAKKIHCSQNPFTPSMVPGCNLLLCQLVFCKCLVLRWCVVLK